MLDLDELLIRCRDSSSRRFLEEAVQCFRIGAYQSSVVATWIACCFDLFGKIRELSRSGVQRASELVRDVETYQRQISEGNFQGTQAALSFERDILNKAMSLELIDPQAMTDLRRLQEDRNRAAHPLFELHAFPRLVTAEQARLHLRNVVDWVLSQPPVQGRAALSQLSQLSRSNTLPSRKRDIVAYLRATPVANGTDALVRGFVDFLQHELLTEDRARTARILEALFELRPQLAEQRFREQFVRRFDTVLDEEFANFAYLVFRLRTAFSATSDVQRERIRQFIQNGRFEAVVPLLGDIVGHGSLGRVEALRRVEQLATDEFMAAVANVPSARGAFVERAVDTYCASRSWDSANRTYNLILEPVIGHAVRRHYEKILQTAIDGSGDLNGAHSFTTVLQKALDHGFLEKDDLIGKLRDGRLDYYADTLSTYEPDIPF